MVARVTVLAAIFALLVVVTVSFSLWNGQKAIVSTHSQAVSVDGPGVQKAPAASPPRAGENELATKRIGSKRATILGLMMMFGAQHGR